MRHLMAILVVLSILANGSFASAAALTFGREKLKSTTNSSTSSATTAASSGADLYPVGPVTYHAYGAISGDGSLYSVKYQRGRYNRNITGVQVISTGEYKITLYNPPADTVCMASTQQPVACEASELYAGAVRVTCVNQARTLMVPTYFTLQCMGP